mgnify:CR=1 FL=1
MLFRSSGYSGAGKNIKKKFKFKYLFDSVRAYGVGSHRHMAEIDQELSSVAKKKINISFTPHLIPMFRGILSTMYLETKKGINAKNIYIFLKRLKTLNLYTFFYFYSKTIYKKKYRGAPPPGATPKGGFDMSQSGRETFLPPPPSLPARSSSEGARN